MNELLDVVIVYSKVKGLDLDGLVLKILNTKRPSKDSVHAMNNLYRDRFGKIGAGKCNCGEIHQIFEDKVIWNSSIPANFISKLINLKKVSFAKALLALED